MVVFDADHVAAGLARPLLPPLLKKSPDCVLPSLNSSAAPSNSSCWCCLLCKKVPWGYILVSCDFVFSAAAAAYIMPIEESGGI